MRPLRLLAVLSAICLLSTPSPGRRWRPQQIPNGFELDEEGCVNCHIDPAGGGPRNLFGQAVELLVEVGGREDFWSPELALVDSDGDGFSNGTELQDPQGLWDPEEDPPGNPNLVSFPGDPLSFPPGEPSRTPTPNLSPTFTPTFTPTWTPTASPTNTRRILPPDLTEDGTVNAADLLELVHRCGTEELDCDFNLDDSEDFADILFFITFWTKITSHPPEIAPFDILYAREGDLLEHPFGVLDIDGDILNFELLDGPVGSDLDPETGLFSWTPERGQAGSHFLRIRVSDDGIPPMESIAQGLVFCLEEDYPINQPPEVGEKGIYRAYPGFGIELPIDATDPEEGRLEFEFTGLPLGASFDTETNVVSWIPAEDQVGLFHVPFAVTDSGLPPESVERILIFKITPVESCLIADCDAETGCAYEQEPIDNDCCQGEPDLRVPEPEAGCPEGRILSFGRNQIGFGRLQNCDRLQFTPFAQGFGAVITLHFEARCLNTVDDATLHVRLTTEDRTLVNSRRRVNLRERDDGYAQFLNMPLIISGAVSNQALENADALLSARLTDADGVTVDETVRVRLTLSDLADIPDPVGEEIITNEIGCTGCHRPRNELGDPVGIEEAHPWYPLSCTDCHGGNDRTSARAEAHVSSGTAGRFLRNLASDQLDKVPLDYVRFINPGDLRVASFGCGAGNPANLGGACHQNKVDTVLLSAMSTYAGHYSRPRFLAGSQSRETELAAVDRCDPGYDPSAAPYGAIECMAALREPDPDLDRSSIQAVVDTYLPKSCPTCHLSDFGRNNAPGVYRSSGCSACHMLYAEDGLSQSEDPTISKFFPPHPLEHGLTSAIPTEQCAHCHFQGGRIGLSYRGIREGGFLPEKTPPNGVTLGRNLYGHGPDFYFVDEDSTNDFDETPPDLHAQAGMVCADCHIGGDVHGDGNLYSGERYQVGSRCEDCHGSVREEIQEVDGHFRNAKGFPYKRLQRTQDDRILLKLTMEDRELEVPQIHRLLENGSNPRMTQAMGVNQEGYSHTDDIECYTCHTSWRLSCMGCHVTVNDQLFAPNRTTGLLSRGAISAGRDDYSIDLFAIGMNHRGKISPLCNSMSVYFTYIDENGVERYRDRVRTSSDGKTGFGWNPFHFHTVSRVPINCDRCHTTDPSSGLADNADKLRETYGFGNGQHLSEDGEGVIRDLSAFLNEAGELVSDFPLPDTHPVPADVRERATSIQVVPHPRDP